GYDPDNRLLAVESEGGGRIEFVYDAFGRRIAKKTKDGETGFLWDGDVLLAELSADRSDEYVFAPDSHAPLCRFNGEVFGTYYNDHLGTPRELTDEQGRVVWSGAYDTYGRISRLQVSETTNQIRFQGQYEDPETGLYYNRFRYYDPDAGRYIHKDPVGLLGGLNPYTYTLNPINWIDPLGLKKSVITYVGMDKSTQKPYVGYASGPASMTPDQVLQRRYSGDFSRFESRPDIIYSGSDKATG